jgi:hypothetical protein
MFGGALALQGDLGSNNYKEQEVLRISELIGKVRKSNGFENSIKPSSDYYPRLLCQPEVLNKNPTVWLDEARQP